MKNLYLTLIYVSLYKLSTMVMARLNLNTSKELYITNDLYKYIKEVM